MKRCVVNFADNSGWYNRGQKRLISCKNLINSDILTYNNYIQIGSPTHHENPYAFKVYSIKKAIDAGYTTILYLDASFFPVKDITPVFEHIEEKGHLFPLCGHMVDRWCNDNCRKYFNLSHEESKGMALYSAGFTGIDFTNEKSKEFFYKWFDSCNAACCINE